MKWKYVLLASVLTIALTTGILGNINRQPKYNPAQTAAITAANIIKQKTIAKKKKPCACCEMRIDKLKKIIERARTRQSSVK